jgi:hypothetical protein
MDDYVPDKDFNAHCIQFRDSKAYTDEGRHSDGTPLFQGRFPDQKISIHDLLHDPEVNPLKRLDSNNKNTIRYFHLPANNMKVWALAQVPE